MSENTQAKDSRVIDRLLAWLIGEQLNAMTGGVPGRSAAMTEVIAKLGEIIKEEEDKS